MPYVPLAVIPRGRKRTVLHNVPVKSVHALVSMQRYLHAQGENIDGKDGHLGQYPRKSSGDDYVYCVRQCPFYTPNRRLLESLDLAFPCLPFRAAFTGMN